MPLSQIGAASLDSAQSGSAPVYGARAWVNFNGTGTVAIRASGNVSSITDNGTGDYTVNFATAMADANYSANIVPLSSGALYPGAVGLTSYSSSSLRFRTVRYNGTTLTDESDCFFSVFR